MLKLNLGDRGESHEGYTGIDIARGEDARSLSYTDVDEVRASHILEHFAEIEIQAALSEWFRVLKPGGMIKIAVPDFRVLSEQYLSGAKLNLQGYVMGGQVDQYDFHKTIFDED